MAGDRIGHINALLVETAEAHDRFEATELAGVYDQEWAKWYAAYAVAHGIDALVGHAVTSERLAEFLASTNAEFEQIEPKPSDPWAAYTARRVASEL